MRRAVALIDDLRARKEKKTAAPMGRCKEEDKEKGDGPLPVFSSSASPPGLAATGEKKRGGRVPRVTPWGGMARRKKKKRKRRELPCRLPACMRRSSSVRSSRRNREEKGKEKGGRKMAKQSGEEKEKKKRKRDGCLGRGCF